MTDLQPQLGTCPRCGSDDKSAFRQGGGLPVGSCWFPDDFDLWHSQAVPQARPAPPENPRTWVDKTPAYVEGERQKFQPDLARCKNCGKVDNMHHADGTCARVSVGAQPGCPECGGIPCANLDVCKAPAPDLEQQLTDAAFPVGSNSANAQLVVDLGEAIDIVARSRTGSSPERAAHPESRGAGAEPDELVVEIARELYDRFAMGGWEPQDAYGSIVIWLERARTAPPSSPVAATGEKEAESE